MIPLFIIIYVLYTDAAYTSLLTSSTFYIDTISPQNQFLLFVYNMDLYL
jgi:hypothetical protein